MEKQAFTFHNQHSFVEKSPVIAAVDGEVKFTTGVIALFVPHAVIGMLCIHQCTTIAMLGQVKLQLVYIC